MKRFFSMILGLAVALSALQAQNSLTVSNVLMKQGETVALSVELNNETEFTAFQMKMKLPEGFGVATTINEDGDEVLDVALNAERMKSSHLLQSFVLEDGAISIGAISTKNATFKGTSGEILQIRLVATEAAVAGDYAVQLYDIIFTTNEPKDFRFDPMTFGLNYSASVPVDPENPDVPVDPEDPDVPVDPELPTTPVNEISATDLYLEGEDGLAILSVELNNETEFSGFQMDLMLPEGFVVATTMNEDDDEVLDIALGEDRKKSTHTLDGDVVSSGAVRVTSISLANATYKGTSGEIVQFRIVPTAAAKPGTYTVEISNVIFSTPESVEYRLSSVSIQMVYKASQGGEVEVPNHSVTVSAGQYGRCIFGNYVLEANESHTQPDAIKHGDAIRLFFVPFEGYTACSMMRNGEVVAIQGNVYEENVLEDVTFADVNYKKIVDTLVVKETIVDTLIVKEVETVVDTLVVTETVVEVDTVVVTETVVEVDTVVVTETIVEVDTVVAEKVDTIIITEIEELPTPVITCANGVVTITCEESDVTILYVINGDPLEGTVYTAPFEVAEDVVVSAVAVRSGDKAELSVKGTSVAQSQMRVVSRRYYDENGVELTSPEDGVTIVAAEYEDGSTRVYKMVRR